MIMILVNKTRLINKSNLCNATRFSNKINEINKKVYMQKNNNDNWNKAITITIMRQLKLVQEISKKMSLISIIIPNLPVGVCAVSQDFF